MGQRHVKNKRKRQNKTIQNGTSVNTQSNNIEIQEITDDEQSKDIEIQEITDDEQSKDIEIQEENINKQEIIDIKKEKKLDLIDINQDLHTCRNRRLSPSQKNDLLNIKRRANLKASKTIKIIQVKNIVTLRFKLKEFRKLLIASTKDINRLKLLYKTTFITTIVMILSTQILGQYIINHRPTIKDNVNTIINISMNNENNTLNFDLNAISIIDKYNINLGIDRLGWIKGDINTYSKEYTINDRVYTLNSQTELSSLIIQPSQIYIEYKNLEGTASKELIFASNKPEQINTKQLKRIKHNMYEKANSVQVQTTLKSYHDSFIMMIETIAGGQLNTRTQEQQILGLEDNIVTSNNENNIVLELDGLGEINTSKIEEISDSTRLTYNKNEDILRVGNSTENIDYIYIFGINNNIMKVNAEDLLATNYDNIYMTVGYSDPDNNAFRTLVISTETSLYCIKFNGLADESLRKNVFEQLGIEITDEIKINTIQKFVDIQ